MVEDLVNRYRMSVSQMTTYIFRLSKSFFPLPRPNTRFVTRKIATGATSCTGTAYSSGRSDYIVGF